MEDKRKRKQNSEHIRKRVEALKGKKYPKKKYPNRGMGNKKHSKKSKKKMSNSLKGKKTWNEGKKLGFIPKASFKKGHVPWNKGLTKENNKILKKVSENSKGRKISEEWKSKMSDSAKKKWKNPEYKKKMSEIHKGYAMPEEQKKKISGSEKGEKHYNWQGGKINQRKGYHWNELRKQVLEKHNNKCVRCGKKGKLDIHHKIPFRKKQEHKIENLIPFCRSCHIKEEQKMRVNSN